MTQRAFIAGIEHYLRIPEPAEGALASAAMIGDLLVSRYGFDRNSEICCPAESGLNKQAILDGLDWLTRGLVAGDRICFYFMGHGASDSSDGYLLAVDCHGFFDKAVSGTELRTALLPIPERVEIVVILDACNAGAIPKRAEGQDRRSLPARARSDRPPAGRSFDALVATLSPGVNAAILAACNGDEYANCDSFPPGTETVGVFTKFLAGRLTANPKSSISAVMRGVCADICRYVAGSGGASPQHPLLAGIRGIRNRSFLEAFSAGDPFDTTDGREACATSP